MRRSCVARLRCWAVRGLRLQAYLEAPGDGRRRGRLPAAVLLWSLVLVRLLRQASFLAAEQLARQPAARASGLSRPFSHDSLRYFTARLDAERLRQALAAVIRRAKRNKAFENSAFIGLALDGSTAGGSRQARCVLCRPYFDRDHQLVGHRHHWVLLTVVGTGLSLPVDVEPYGPGDSEQAAGERLLARAVANLGRRFADYVVADGKFATARFLHLADRLGLKVVVRLKENLPELAAAARRRFQGQPPRYRFRDGDDEVELWEASDFDPWDGLNWLSVRVVYYRQKKPNGEVYEAYWLTNFSPSRVLGPSLYRMAKSRWEVENQGWNVLKNHYRVGHICHHQVNSLLVSWLLTLLAVVIERLYRLRYLHRGRHPQPSAGSFCRLLWLSLGHPAVLDTS